MNCIICDKDILDGDIFMMIKIDMRRLIYDICHDENNFLVPDGPVHLMTKLTLCENCSKDMMKLSSKGIAISMIQVKL
jgi:hypothetical protein